MKSAIRFIILFCIAFLAVDTGIYAVLEHCHQRAVYDAPQGVVNWYLREQKRHEIIVLGASKSKYGVATHQLGPSAFNLAWGGMDDAYATCVVSLLLENALAPKAVILGVSPQNYYGQTESEPYVATNPLYLKYYYPENEVVRRYVRETSPFEPLKFLSQSYRFNPNALNLLNSYRRVLKNGSETRFQELVESQGHVALPAPTDQTKAEQWLKEVQEQFETSQLKSAPTQVVAARLRYLRDLVELCRQNNIELTILVLPQLLGLDPQQVTAACEELQELARDNDHVSLVDFARETPLSGLDWRSWADRYHFSDAGAKRMTAELVNRLREEPHWGELLQSSKPTR